MNSFPPKAGDRISPIASAEPSGGPAHHLLSRNTPHCQRSGSPEFKVPSSSGRSFFRFSAHVPRSMVDPGGTSDPRLIGSHGIGFSILLLNLLPHLHIYGAVSTLRADAIRPVAHVLPCVCFANDVSPTGSDLQGRRLPVLTVLFTQRPSA